MSRDECAAAQDRDPRLTRSSEVGSVLDNKEGTDGGHASDEGRVGANTAPGRSSAMRGHLLRRIRLTWWMTLDYDGRFPRRKLVRVYWRLAGRMVSGV